MFLNVEQSTLHHVLVLAEIDELVHLALSQRKKTGDPQEATSDNEFRALVEATLPSTFDLLRMSSLKFVRSSYLDAIENDRWPGACFLRTGVNLQGFHLLCHSSPLLVVVLSR